MRVTKIENYNNDNEYVTYKVPRVYNVDMRYNIMSDKDKIGLIKNVEAIARRSLEYKMYIHFLKTEIDMTCCSFYNNVNSTKGKISIEIHHEPFTLFDIAETVVNKFITEDMEINPLLIAREVMILHYKNMVGLIPVSKTVHQLIHDGKVFVPLQNVYGKYTKFLKEYGDYISPDNLGILEAKLEMSKVTQDLSILKTKYVYLNVDGFELPQPRQVSA